MSVEKHVVLVSRQWHNPDIRVDVTPDGIGISATLPDFLAAMVEEAGSPLFTMTKAQQLRALTAAAERVVAGMKAETARVM